IRQIHTDTSQTGLNGHLYQHRHTLPGLSLIQSQHSENGSLQAQASLLYHWDRYSSVETLTLPNVARLALPQHFWLLQTQFSADRRLGNHHWRWDGGLQTSFGTRLLPVFQASIDGMYRVRGYPDGVTSGDDLLWLRSEWLPWAP